jgi:Ribbon-helix-helix domain
MLRTPTSKKPSWNSPKHLEVRQPRLRLGRMGQLNSLVVKRSVVIAGRKTSISLEDAFWNSLREIAHMRKETLSQLVASIDANRKTANLSLSHSGFCS